MMVRRGYRGRMLAFALLVITSSTAANGAGVLFGVANEGDRLVTIDTATGAITNVGPLSFLNPQGLTYDSAANELIGVDANERRIYRIDRQSGAGVPVGAVGALGFNAVFSLAYDSLGGTLFGVDAASDQLIRINTTTGIGTAIGPIGGSLVSIVGLAHDESSGTLYAFDNATDQLVTIDKATGVGTAVGAVGFGAVFGLAFDAMTGDLFGADLSSPSQLLTINPLTGAGTAIGPLVGGGSSGITGLAFAPAVPVPGTLLLLLSGLSAVATLRFRRQESS